MAAEVQPGGSAARRRHSHGAGTGADGVNWEELGGIGHVGAIPAHAATTRRDSGTHLPIMMLTALVSVVVVASITAVT